MPSIYRGMDQETLDAAYNNTAHFGQARRDALVADWTERGERLRATRPHQANLPYGNSAREVLDFVPCGVPRAPTVAYIHGGYWQWNTKDSSLFLAAGPLSKGFNFANVEYTLAPDQSMDGIVGEIGRAIAWLLDNLEQLGGAPDKLYVAGHSAGGHLTAIAMENPRVAGGLAISGLFDLEPIRLSILNAKIGMDAAAAKRNSPLYRLPAHAGKLWITAGGGELTELQRQSVEYFAAFRAAGLRTEFVPTPLHNHFTILEELAQPEGFLTRSLAALAGDLPPPAF